MKELSPSAQAVLILINAQKHVLSRCDGSWWLMDDLKWAIIPTLRKSSEWDFLLAVMRAERLRAAA